MSDRNEEKLKGWDRVGLFFYPSGHDDRVVRCCLAYMVRCLSRYRIPDADLVMKTLEGELEVPECGWLGCNADHEHVH